jgi:hypothetical protein
MSDSKSTPKGFKAILGSLLIILAILVIYVIIHDKGFSLNLLPTIPTIADFFTSNSLNPLWIIVAAAFMAVYFLLNYMHNAMRDRKLTTQEKPVPQRNTIKQSEDQTEKTIYCSSCGSPCKTKDPPRLNGIVYYLCDFCKANDQIIADKKRMEKPTEKNLNRTGQPREQNRIKAIEIGSLSDRKYVLDFSLMDLDIFDKIPSLPKSQVLLSQIEILEMELLNRKMERVLEKLEVRGF